MIKLTVKLHKNGVFRIVSGAGADTVEAAQRIAITNPDTDFAEFIGVESYEGEQYSDCGDFNGD
jgi:hypothetical protein